MNVCGLLMTPSEGEIPIQIFLEKFGPFIAHRDIYSHIHRLLYSFSMGMLLISKKLKIFFLVVNYVSQGFHSCDQTSGRNIFLKGRISLGLQSQRFPTIVGQFRCSRVEMRQDAAMVEARQNKVAHLMAAKKQKGITESMTQMYPSNTCPRGLTSSHRVLPPTVPPFPDSLSDGNPPMD